MRDRVVSDELAIAVIDLVRTCESHNHPYYLLDEAEYNPCPPGERATAYDREVWERYLEGVKSSIANVLELLAVEVAKDLGEAVEVPDAH